MSQSVPRHSFSLRLLAGQPQSGVEINKLLSGFLVVEDVFVLPSQIAEFQNRAHFRIDRNDAKFLGLIRERVDHAFVQVHVLPPQRENLANPASRIQGINDDVLNRGSRTLPQPGSSSGLGTRKPVLTS